jgi:hypothetical protein
MFQRPACKTGGLRSGFTRGAVQGVVVSAKGEAAVAVML